jgi:WD40 repeat protein
MESLRTGAAVAEALAEAHRHGVLHRDLKPENILVTPEGTRRVVAREEALNGLCLWDYPLAATPRVLLGHSAQVRGLAFSRDGRWLASGSFDKTIRLWDLSRPSEPQVLRGHTSYVEEVAFSSDGKRAVTGSDDGTVRLWDTATGNPVWRGPALFRDPPQLLSHRGWQLLDGSSGAPRFGTTNWRWAIDLRARFVAEPEDGRTLCLRAHRSRLEIWDRVSDRLLRETAVPELSWVVAVPGGCVALAQGGATLFLGSGKVVRLDEGASAVAWDRGQILVAAGRKVHLHDRLGHPEGTRDADLNVTAMTRIGERLYLGFRDGNIEASGNVTFQDVPASPVVRLLAGPRATLVAGFANGIVGIWRADGGVRLYHSWLHGPVAHLLLQSGKLYAATELGDHVVWDLSLLEMPYCDVLRQVWKSVPVLWEGGSPVLRPPPSDHGCSR